MEDEFTTIQLLEATHTFPCAYRFKVIGATGDHFVGRALAAVRQEFPEGTEPPFSTRTTAGGRHVCVTIEPVVESAVHVLLVYQRLRTLEGLVMML